jgi:hypothetical protein
MPPCGSVDAATMIGTRRKIGGRHAILALARLPLRKPIPAPEAMSPASQQGFEGPAM